MFKANRTPSKNTENASSDPGTSASGERRRLSRIVHDERGTAIVEWHDAPDDFVRPVFRIEGTGVHDLAIEEKKKDTYNPYDRTPDRATLPRQKPLQTGKRDLRKLSEWIKMTRELDERKKRGEE